MNSFGPKNVGIPSINRPNYWMSIETTRVELFHDDEAGNWHYRVPALHINGGGTATREEAEHHCLGTNAQPAPAPSGTFRISLRPDPLLAARRRQSLGQ